MLVSDDLVYEQILYSRSTSSTKKVIDEDYAGIVVSDQCPSYNWIAAERHQLCWAHVKRNLQQMADYSGGGHTAYIDKHMIFRATPPIFNKSNSPGERVLCFRIICVTQQADAT